MPFSTPGGVRRSARWSPRAVGKTCEVVSHLLAARDLACVTTRCHGCPTEATLSQRTASSERVSSSCQLPETRVAIKPCGGGRACAWLYPASTEGHQRWGTSTGVHGSARLQRSTPRAGSERCRIDFSDWLAKAYSGDKTSHKKRVRVPPVSQFTACAPAPGKCNISLTWLTGMVPSTSS